MPIWIISSRSMVYNRSSIRDTLQQLGVAELRMNRSISEGIATLVSQCSLARIRREDAADLAPWQTRLLSSVTKLTPYELSMYPCPSLTMMNSIHSSHQFYLHCLRLLHRPLSRLLVFPLIRSPPRLPSPEPAPSAVSEA